MAAPQQALLATAVESGVAATDLHFIYVPSAASGSLLTTALWAAGKIGEAPGTMSYANGSSHAGGATAPLDHTYLIDDPQTFGIPRKISGVTYDGASQSIHIDESGRSGLDNLYETILETGPFPSASGTFSVCGYLNSDYDGDAAGDANIDHYSILTGAFGVLQQSIPGVAPTGSGTIYAHASGANGVGVVPTKGVWRYWTLLYNVDEEEIWMMLQDAATGALIGTSRGLAPGITSPPTGTSLGDYLTSWGGDIYHKEIGGRFDDLFPVDVNFVAPDPTSPNVEQTAADEMNFEFFGVTPPSSANLERFTIERNKNSGGFVEVSALQVEWFYTDTDVADGDTVQYRVKVTIAGIHVSGWAVSNTETVDNSAFVGPPPDILWTLCNEGTGTDVASDVGPDLTTNGDWTTLTQNGAGAALVFTGPNEIASSNSAITFGTNVITVQFWAQSSGYSGVMFYSGFNGADYAWAINSGSGSFTAIVGGASGSSTQKTSPVPGDANWHLCTFVLDGTTNPATVKAYIDAVAQTVTPVFSDRSGTANFAAYTLSVGAYPGGLFGYTGNIDDIQIYAGERSAAYILGDYTTGAR